MTSGACGDEASAIHIYNTNFWGRFHARTRHRRWPAVLDRGTLPALPLIYSLLDDARMALRRVIRDARSGALLRRHEAP